MTIERLKALAQAYGADLRRWFDDAKKKAREAQTDVDKLLEVVRAFEKNRIRIKIKDFAAVLDNF